MIACIRIPFICINLLENNKTENKKYYIIKFRVTITINRGKNGE